MTPIRAGIVGPPFSATSASKAACHSGGEECAPSERVVV